MTIAINHVIGFLFGKNSYAAVSFFLCTEPVMMKTQRFQLLNVYIIFGGLGFLQANDIGRVGFKPVYESFFHGGTYAVYIIRDDTHGF